MGRPTLIFLAGSLDFSLWGVRKDGFNCLHADIHRWSHKVLRDLRAAIREVSGRIAAPTIMLAGLPSARPDQDRFLRLLGASPVGPAGEYEGRPLTAWAMNQEDPHGV